MFPCITSTRRSATSRISRQRWPSANTSPQPREVCCKTLHRLPARPQRWRFVSVGNRLWAALVQCFIVFVSIFHQPRWNNSCSNFITLCFEIPSGFLLGTVVRTALLLSQISSDGSRRRNSCPCSLGEHPPSSQNLPDQARGRPAWCQARASARCASSITS